MKNIDLETTYTDMDYIQNQINLFLSHVNIANVILKTFKDVEDNIHKMDILMQRCSKDGKIIGTYVDQMIIKRLNETNINYRHGKDTTEKDCMCLNNKEFSFELKTSSRSTVPVGSKTNAGNVNNGTKYSGNDDYGFMVFCRYNFGETPDREICLIPKNMYIGMYKPSDFKSSKSNGSGSATIPAKIFHNQFIKIYG